MAPARSLAISSSKSFVLTACNPSTIRSDSGDTLETDLDAHVRTVLVIADSAEDVEIVAELDHR